MEDFEDFGPDADDEPGDADPPTDRYSDDDRSEAHIHPDFARSSGAFE